MPEELNMRGVRSCALALFVINHIFEKCPQLFKGAVFRQTSIISQDYPLHAPACTLFTDIEQKAYNRVRYQKDCVYQYNNTLYKKEDDEKILSASFFDVNNIDNLKERRNRMKMAERKHIESMGFIINEQS